METVRLTGPTVSGNSSCRAFALSTVFQAYTILDREFSPTLSFADPPPDTASPFPVLGLQNSVFLN